MTKDPKQTDLEEFINKQHNKKMKRKHDDIDPFIEKKEEYEKKISQAEAYSESESAGEDEATTIKLKYKEKTIHANEIGQDDGWVELNSSSNRSISAICSYGFASCLATIIKSPDRGGYIALRHDTFGEDDYNFIDQVIKEKISKGAEVFFGFSWAGFKEDYDMQLEMGPEYLTQEDYDRAMEKKKIFLKTLAERYQTEVIDLPQSTVLIDRAGCIDTSIPNQTMYDAPRSIEEKRPSASPSSPKVSDKFEKPRIR